MKCKRKHISTFRADSVLTVFTKSSLTGAQPVESAEELTCRNLTMLSLGLASFFSVGAVLKSSAGSTLSQLLYFPGKRKTFGLRDVRGTGRVYRAILRRHANNDLTYEIQAHHMSTHRGHLKTHALSHEGAGVFMHRTCSIEALAAGAAT